jgi:hypothetical protein
MDLTSGSASKGQEQCGLTQSRIMPQIFYRLRSYGLLSYEDDRRPQDPAHKGQGRSSHGVDEGVTKQEMWSSPPTRPRGLRPRWHAQ